MSHEAYSPVGYSYQADNYCLDCIPLVVRIPNLYGLDERGRKKIAVNNGGTGYQRGQCNCAECRLDRIAKSRGIDRMDESSFDMDDFPKSIPYHNDGHSECVTPNDPNADDDYPNGACYFYCSKCHEVIDGVSKLDGPDVCPVIDNWEVYS